MSDEHRDELQDEVQASGGSTERLNRHLQRSHSEQARYLSAYFGWSLHGRALEGAQRQADGDAPAGDEPRLRIVEQRRQRAAGIRSVTKCSERQHGNGRDQATNGNAGLYTRHHRNIP